MIQSLIRLPREIKRIALLNLHLEEVLTVGEGANIVVAVVQQTHPAVAVVEDRDRNLLVEGGIVIGDPDVDCILDCSYGLFVCCAV